jgi:hypothetical protein
MDSYDVRFWDIKKLGAGSGARYRVRWAVDGREHCKSFRARPLADGFLAGLKDSIRDRRPFNPRTGLPDAETTEEEMITWYEHARAYAEAKWASLAPVSRRSVARHWSPSPSPSPRRSRARPSRKCCGRDCSAGRSTRPPATPTRRPRSLLPWTGQNGPRCPSPIWRTPPPCGWRWPPAPRP